MKRIIFVLVLAIVLGIVPSVFALTSSFNSQYDTFISSGQPNASFANDAFLYVGLDPYYGFNIERSLIYFNPVLPPQQQVNSSKLRLYFRTDESLNPNTSIAINVHPITSSSWINTVPTWNNFGLGGIFDANTVSPLNVGGNTSGYFEWDVTNIVKNWIQNGAINNGFLLKAQDETIGADRAFQSLVFVGEPVLEINHDTIQPPVPPAPPAPVVPSILKTSLSFKVTPGAITVGKAVVIKGQLKDNSGKPVAGKNVKIKANGKAIKIVKTNAGGKFSFKHKPNKTTKYQAVYSGDTSFSTSNSKAVKVTVKKVKKKAKKK